jgi:DNA polymerase elongation subunit (family B)
MRAWDWEDTEVVKRVFLDIETLPAEETMREQIAVKVRRELESSGGQLSDEQANEIADSEFRSTALYGEHGRVLVIGLITEENGAIKHRGVLGRDRATGCFHLNEARTLRAFWNLLRDFDVRRDFIIGHNVLEFDLPFLCKRSIVHRVQPSVKLCFARYRSQPIYDTMKEWAHWSWCKNGATSLDKLAGVLGLVSSKQNGIDGSRVYDYFRDGRHSEIADYCMRDVELVRDIYYRMNFIEKEERQQAG